MLGSMASSPPVQPPDPHRQYQNRLLAYSAAIAVIVVGAGYWYFAQRPKPAANANRNAGPVAVTPENFTDFIGTVTAKADKTISVTAIITHSNGQREQRSYQITVPDDQVMKAVTIDGTTSYQPGSFNDLAVDQTVQVFGSDNLASLTTFTAKKVVLLP